MNTRINHKRYLLDELDRLIALPGNWDEQGGAQASPRATGNYRAFLDLVTEPKKEFTPHLDPDGSIRVQWRSKVGGKFSDAVIVFYGNGGMYLGFDGKGNMFDQVDRDRLRDFVYVAG